MRQARGACGGTACAWPRDVQHWRTALQRQGERAITLTTVTMAPRIHDISRPIVAGGPVYPGNPAVRTRPAQAISEGASANVTEVMLGSHTGTHCDAPRHFADDGAPVDELPLDVLIGRARLIQLESSVRAIGESDLRPFELLGTRRLLLRTANSESALDAPFRNDYTYLAPDGAEYLVRQGVALVGIDSLSIEQFHSGHHRTHLTLLGAGVVIVEGLALAGVPAGPYQLICLPLRLAGLDGAPARAVLMELGPDDQAPSPSPVN